MLKRFRMKKNERYLNPREGYYIKSPAVYFSYAGTAFIINRVLKLKRGVELRRHTDVSRGIYEKHDDVEMRVYEQGKRYTYDHGQMRLVSFKDIRHAYLEPIINEIERQLAEKPKTKLKVLEVGCGNVINLMILHERFGDKVSFYGFDISPNRIKNGQEYWGDRIKDIQLTVDSATQLENYQDNTFDVVYSVHCLEQIPYAIGTAVAAIERVAKNRIVFVEPMFEYANTAQKIYTILGDQCRTLMPEVNAAKGLEIVDTFPIDILANPLNKTGVIVAQKIHAEK